MEINKYEAERCIELAKAALTAENLAKAEKLLKKSQSLYPLPEAELLLKRVNREAAYKPSTPKLNVDYTQDQLDVVKRVQKCQDFYDLLGVSHEAPVAEIKKCYKKLALMLHPDKNKAPGAMEAFKALSNAVETLRDPEKRKAYDLNRTTDNGSGPGRKRPRGGFTYGQNEFTFRPDFESEGYPDDSFNMFFGGGFPQQQQQQQWYQQQLEQQQILQQMLLVLQQQVQQQPHQQRQQQRKRQWHQQWHQEQQQQQQQHQQQHQQRKKQRKKQRQQQQAKQQQKQKQQ